ncbi:MAG: hypothetical protein U0703_11905 [Anaerolineae bacterium]
MTVVTCPTFPYTVPAANTTALITAVTCANNNATNDTINLNNSTYTLTTADNATDGGNGLPVIVDAATAGTLTINGNGATIARSSAGGTAEFRILKSPAAAIWLSTGRSLQMGIHPIPAVLSIMQAGRSRLATARFPSNSALTVGTGSAIENGGMLTVINTTFSTNLAVGGGALDNIGTAVVINNTFANNTASFGGAIDNYGGALR